LTKKGGARNDTNLEKVIELFGTKRSNLTDPSPSVRVSRINSRFEVQGSESGRGWHLVKMVKKRY